MRSKNIIFVILIALIATASLLSHTANALSAATMSLTGASNTNGNFSVIVYENTSADTVTTAYVALDFSSAVSNVTYDYSVGPFQTRLPSGAYSITGETSGLQPVARVTFTMPTTGSVTATVSPASFLKHAVRDSSGKTTGMTENFAIVRGSATFSYTAPRPANDPAPVTPSTPTQQQSSTPTRPNAPVVSQTATTTPQNTDETPATPATSETSNDEQTATPEVAGESSEHDASSTATDNNKRSSWFFIIPATAMITIGGLLALMWQRKNA